MFPARALNIVARAGNRCKISIHYMLHKLVIVDTTAAPLLRVFVNVFILISKVSFFFIYLETRLCGICISAVLFSFRLFLQTQAKLRLALNPVLRAYAACLYPKFLRSNSNFSLSWPDNLPWLLRE